MTMNPGSSSNSGNPQMDSASIASPAPVTIPVPGPIKTEAALWSPRRINRLAKCLGSRSYLEIGVHDGKTFNAVAIADRTGVDPNFRFDVAKVINEHTRLEPVTSDHFFGNLPVGKTFDLIFLDGLHTFEQTYRDMCNCLLHAYSRTVILIDDTKPSDVYSALPDMKRAIETRKAAGVQGYSWHGDVFKVVFALHDFHPGLNYRTIMGSGNPQTLVWQSNIGWREPRFNNLERISRLTYFDLLDEIGILRVSTEDEAIGACLAELAETTGQSPQGSA